MSARLSELLIFSFLLPVGLWGLVQAFRRDRTWVAGALVFIAGCVFSIAVTLRGYPLMGGGHYGVDHRASPSPASAGDVALAVLAALVPVVAWLALGAWRRRQMEATSASTSIASCSRWSGATRGGRNRSTLP